MNITYEGPFRPGDVLAEDPTKEFEPRKRQNVVTGKYLGDDEIIVVRLEDGVVDSVWPEEVREIT